MNAARILKMSGALMSGQGINVASQFILPPLFLKTYGIAMYGEWLTLSATVSYLATLNFGLQTFANNQAGIASNRGEAEEVKTIQATALGILLAIVLGAALVSTIAFYLPISSWLKLSIPNLDAAWITYLLGLQILARMLFGFVTGGFIVAGAAHRGQNWNNALSIASLIVTAGAALLHSELKTIAALQLAVLFTVGAAVLLDLKSIAPLAVPNLKYAQFSRCAQILKPSVYFAMLYSSNFLVYQLPLLAMNRILGPSSVVVFSLTRTVFSMSRAILNALSQALQPEIVELYGKQNFSQLHRLYDLSERAIFALTPLVSMGTFAATPLLMGLWLHKPQLYNAQVCFYMALISAVMGIKEHKYVFQTSANEHTAMAKWVFISYTAMVALSLPGIEMFGVKGFLALWLITEASQVIYIVQLNRRLFASEVQLDFRYVYRVSGLLVATSAICFSVSAAFSTWSDPRAIALTLTVISISSAAAYSLFDLGALGAGFGSHFVHRI